MRPSIFVSSKASTVYQGRVIAELLTWLMAKYWLPSVIATLFIVLTGCGGSNNVASGSGTQVGGASLSQYQATLPDGSVMELEILADDSLNWEGEYAVSAETGPYAHQDGTFDGTISGDSVTLNCQNDDGTSFTMTGTGNGQGFQLTRSDIPGTVLNFTPVTPLAPKGRADVSFNLNVTGSSGRCVLSDSAYSSSNGLTEYRGTWQGLKVTFWAYSSGYANIVIYVNDYAIDSLSYASYRLTDFTTVSKNSSNGYMNVYSPVTKVILKFGAVGAVSP